MFIIYLNDCHVFIAVKHKTNKQTNITKKNKAEQIQKTKTNKKIKNRRKWTLVLYIVFRILSIQSIT
jgi:hypothetical protein